MTRSDIRFIFRGKVHSLTGLAVQKTVLQWLREDMKALGTKEGCAEGDCGACTVALASLDFQAPGGVRIRAVNSCIQFLPSLDGKALFTVEDLAQEGKLHPVQQALVDQHGSQCGFCTPGFVMSLWTDYENRAEVPQTADLMDVLSGNLCRCTGYRPIIDAAKESRKFPRRVIDRKALKSALEGLAALDELSYEEAGVRFYAPKTLKAFAQYYAENPKELLVSGSTDVGLWVNKQQRSLGNMIYLGQLGELKDIQKTSDYLFLGAGLSLSDSFTALIEEDPAWKPLGRYFASMPVRNAGTLGGNIANGSPIGDSMPPLIALGARVVLQKKDQVRELPLEDLYLAYRKNALEAGEFVRGVKVPRNTKERFFRVWKVSKRPDQDISAVCGAFSFTRGPDNCLKNLRLAFGGVAAVPLRARNTEKALEGKSLSLENLEACASSLDSDFSPLEDMRASAEYRRTLAFNLLKRFILEASGSESPLELEEVLQ